MSEFSPMEIPAVSSTEGSIASSSPSPVRSLPRGLRDEDLEEDHASLEYEEDCYYAYVAESGTPSFDHVWPDDEDGNDDEYVECDSGGILPLSGLDDTLCVEEEDCCVEAEFTSKSPKAFRKGKNKKSVRVTFQNLSKPYLAKVSSPRNYRRFLQLVKAEEAPMDMSPDSGINELQGLTPEEQERQRQEWQQELAKVEEEIQTLRHVLASKVKMSQDLKRKLGISVWREFQDDMSQGIRNVKESNVGLFAHEIIAILEEAVEDAANIFIEPPEGNVESDEDSGEEDGGGKLDNLGSNFQKTESVIKTTAEKTTSLLGGFGSSVTMKLGQLKNSDSFRSLEERVGSAYENVKTKVVTSRSNSTQSFDEAVREAEANRKSNNGTPATTPTIPEDRPIS